MFIKMLSLQGMLFIIMLMGVVANKLGFLKHETGKSLTDLLLYLILPCNILMSFQVDITTEILRGSVMVLVIGFGVEILSLILSKILFRRYPQNQNAVLQYGLIVSNASFIGLVVMEGVYGSRGLLYGSIALIPLRIFVWSAGISLFTVADNKKMIKTVVTHPCVVTVIIGFLMMCFNLKFPAFLSKTLSTVGGCTTTVSMLIIGNTLAGVHIKTVFSKPVLYFCAIRLVIMPVIVYLVLVFAPVDPVIVGVSVLIAGMPAGSTTAILAEKYNCDSVFAAKCVFASTLLSLITITVVCIFLK